VGAQGVGFHYYRPPPDPGQLAINGVAIPAREQLPPVVFVHGLGCGLSPYLDFVRRLTSLRREIFVIELPEVSQACVGSSLPPDSMAQAIACMLGEFGHKRATFLAHSYGTFVLSWVIRRRPDLVAKVVMIDPVNVLLSQPDVAFNFLYRRPKDAFSLALANFVRWELFSANVLMRHFYWYHNVLWREEFPDDCVFALSGCDDIIKPASVRRHLEEWARRPDRPKNQSLKVLWFEGFFHGQVVMNKAAQLQVFAEL